MIIYHNVKKKEEKNHQLLLENLMVLHLNKLECPSSMDALCQFGWNWPSGSGEEMLCAKFGWNWSSGSWKEMKMWKVYRWTDVQTDGLTTDNMWSEKLTWAISSGELKSVDANLKFCYWTNLNALPQNMLCAKFSFNQLSGSKEVENVNNYSLADGWSVGWKMIIKAHLNFQLRWTWNILVIVHVC